MERSTFKSCQGFLVHMGGTYEVIKPYLHGLFLSENVWRSNRNAHQGYHKAGGEGDLVFNDLDGNLLDSAQPERYDDEEEGLLNAFVLDETIGDHHGLHPSHLFGSELPVLVLPVLRLFSDINALEQIFAGETSIQAIEHPVSGAPCVVFGGGDAPGEGLAGSLTSPFGMPPLLRRGFWGVNGSSNWREMKRVLEAIRAEARLGFMVGCEVWMATDNSTAEATFYKGRSSSPELDAIFLELRLIAIAGNFLLRFVHIAGTRMIDIGIDALLRGLFIYIRWKDPPI